MTNTWGESLCLFTAIKVNSPFCRNCIVLLKRFVISLTDRLELALGKPAEQSSTLTPHEAKLAVDGNIGDNVIQGYCAHTGYNDISPWWRVDLQAVYSITFVRILNRGKCP